MSPLPGLIRLKEHEFGVRVCFSLFCFPEIVGLTFRGKGCFWFASFLWGGVVWVDD